MVNIDNNENMGILDVIRQHMNYETKDPRTLPAPSWTGFNHSHTAQHLGRRIEYRDLNHNDLLLILMDQLVISIDFSHIYIYIWQNIVYI